ncbi:Exodeoxyribonuclease 1 [Pleurostoma richardsiae]|uniref:Exodeoxyribonuclease 1 n=1 Tax=Pleurostoma richardsiae TaxID=41990 RepID=A0AA38VRD7_9PEZI|nr:Exodeoxyribonuclease 1 [Pleurostoma richardsiae]
MGIQGLLPLLKSIQKPTELKKFSGETLGVDAYGWLHRGAVSCAIDLAQGKPTRKYVDFAMHRVRMAKYFGVTPYLVFDGDFLPSKACTEASRARRREESRKTGLELLKAGKPSQAHLELQKAIDVTPEMARHLIEELKVAGVPYVVAPYEADAQLVYLERQGLIGGIISEDSDLLVFGAKRLLTKLDQHGQCIEINRRDFCACREISLTGWTDTEFRQMAILNGCDYLDGINNMGLKTAYRMIRKYKTADKVIRMLQFDGKHRMPENYLAAFKQAELTFLHQRVFCPKKRELVLLSEPQSSIDLGEMPYIGAKVDPALARAIALGDVNPISKEPILITALPQKRKGARSLATASVHKKPLGKAIDSYFKGDRRVPLGEMDPNCFAVEPKQEADMTQGGSRPLTNRTGLANAVRAGGFYAPFHLSTAHNRTDISRDP